MLLRFALENWMSFRNRAELSMIASRERQHGERVPHLPKKYRGRVLPITAIYGGNASGKSNLVKALAFAKQFVVMGTQAPGVAIPVAPFRLERSARNSPAVFRFEILVGNDIYDYGFSVTSEAVVKEYLVWVNSQSESVVFERDHQDIRLEKTGENPDFLRFVAQGTRPNQLFLTTAAFQGAPLMAPIYQWFRHTLEIISPESHYLNIHYFMDEDNPLYDRMNAVLPQLDTGIRRMVGKPVATENLPPGVIQSARLIEPMVGEGATVHSIDPETGRRYALTRVGGTWQARKLMFMHTRTDSGEDEPFDYSDESDGTKRLIDLLPAFLGLAEGKQSQKVFVIDEIDRSLHTLMTQALVRAYLDSCSQDSRSQLIMTTHDVLLMDQSLMRRDEMWVIERDDRGASRLWALSDYRDIRYDKDIRKSYLQGRMGGIPRILLAL